MDKDVGRSRTGADLPGRVCSDAERRVAGDRRRLAIRHGLFELQARRDGVQIDRRRMRRAPWGARLVNVLARGRQRA